MNDSNMTDTTRATGFSAEQVAAVLTAAGYDPKRHMLIADLAPGALGHQYRGAYTLTGLMREISAGAVVPAVTMRAALEGDVTFVAADTVTPYEAMRQIEVVEIAEVG